MDKVYVCMFREKKKNRVRNTKRSRDITVQGQMKREGKGTGGTSMKSHRGIIKMII